MELTCKGEQGAHGGLTVTGSGLPLQWLVPMGEEDLFQ